MKTVSEQLLDTLRAAHERSRQGYSITDELARAVTEAEALLAVRELGTCDGNHGGPRCADPECWNDSPPASDQLKDNQIAALVNKVCRVAREFHNHDSLRQRIAQELVPALQATPVPVTGCNCRWQGESQVEWCELHLAHKEAIHDWAQRTKTAEAKLATPEPAREPFGQVTVRRLSRRHANHVDQYQFYPAGQPPYLDNVDECHTVYTSPAPGVPEAVVGLVRFMETAFVPMTPQQEEIKKSLALASASLAAHAKGGR